MSDTDAILLLLVLVSAVLSAFTGLIRTLARLAALGCAVYLALFQSGLLVPVFLELGAVENAAQVMSIATLVAGSLLIGFLIGRGVEGFVNMVGLRGVNILLGVCYGMIRGFALIAVVVVACAHYGIRILDDYWPESDILRLTGFSLKTIGEYENSPAQLREYMANYEFSEDFQPKLGDTNEKQPLGSEELNELPGIPDMLPGDFSKLPEIFEHFPDELKNYSNELDELIGDLKS